MAKAWFTLFKINGAIEAMEKDLIASTEAIRKAVTGFEYTERYLLFFKRTRIMPDYETWVLRRYSLRHNIEYVLCANDKDMSRHFDIYDRLSYQINPTRKYADMAKKSSEQKVFLDYYEFLDFKGWII